MGYDEGIEEMAQGFQADLNVNGVPYAFYPIAQVQGSEHLPFALKVVLENVLRNVADEGSAQAMAERIVAAAQTGSAGDEVEFMPARVLYQDLTGVPVFVDFAVMREAFASLGGNPERINPNIPCDLVIDHSVIADVAGVPDAFEQNTRIEFERNQERYEFFKWAQSSFQNVRIVPPEQGICHQLNIECFANVVTATASEAGRVAYFDTLVGTDSHTPTANGIGVLGWGVGGIEAEAAALGQPITTLVPRVIGIRLTGALQAGVAAMDVALTFAEMLRAKGVVGCFVECFGPGVASLSAQQRAAIANMTPEYGSTCTLFPTDERTLDFLASCGRSEEQVRLVEAYAKEQGFWNTEGADGRVYADIIELDLSSVKPSVSGPSRPHDRMDRGQVYERFCQLCAERGLARTPHEVQMGGQTCSVSDGSIAIAAVTSCTTATDPEMMVQAGLLAKNAAACGLHAKPWVKTILAPGSHATELLLERAGCMDAMQALGFYTCGFGCMSCIGNSGPLAAPMHAVADQVELASVLSGNRNFEGRISPDVSQNYLTTPAHVIAYALLGTMDADIETAPLGVDADGNEVFLADIMPDQAEVDAVVRAHVTADLYAQGTKGMYEGDASWQGLSASASEVFAWAEGSTYVRRPTFFDDMASDSSAPGAIEGARALLFLGDFITTDHISPAGAIAPDMPAANYLRAHGVDDADFNTYGSRRGNHEVMARGTFANVKLENKLAEGKKGGWTRDLLTGQISTVFETAEHYMAEGVPAIVVAGKMYGSGSSRDWAAKGPKLLGVRAVIAESFERIHRSNLIGMGILPLQFLEGESAETHGLVGDEAFSIQAVDFSNGLPEPAVTTVTFIRSDGTQDSFQVQVRVDTPTEGAYFSNGGILQYVMRSMA